MYAAGARRARPMDGPSKTAKRTVVQTVTSATDQHCHNHQHFAFERERTGELSGLVSCLTHSLHLRGCARVQCKARSNARNVSDRTLDACCGFGQCSFCSCVLRAAGRTSCLQQTR